MASVNKIMLIGNVGKDPEIRTTKDGKNVANFSLATSESWRDRDTGEKHEYTEWHRVVIFSPPIVQVVKNYVHKGSKLYIEGTVRTRKWTDVNGIDKYVTEVLVQPYSGVLMLLDPKSSSYSGGHDAGDGGYSGGTKREEGMAHTHIDDIRDDDIPF